MPFGTQILDDGRVRFRLWAPTANKVELSLQGLAPEANIAMGQEDNGWFGLVTELAAAGTCYQFCIDDELYVPDPASRFQADGVHGASQVINPTLWQWNDNGWQGRPWEETVIYELHTGTFTPEGTFNAIIGKLDHLLELGVTAIELMPVAAFPGQRNWGYDGVLLFAPDNSYGRPEDLKQLVQTAHNKGLMVFLDVVYNHFGPEGNYLHRYANHFFTRHHHTPWGDAINFDDQHSDMVRSFFIHNAMYWIEEYHIDGLRFDSAHAIFDDSPDHILAHLARTVEQGPGIDRHIHLVLENYDNAAHYLCGDSINKNACYVAQWNDDTHHALHVLLTGEQDGYYTDYGQQPLRHLGRCLTEGFAYQGEISQYRHGTPRGEPSGHLPLTAFVEFLQNHDQIGNRALGDRITELASPEAVRAAMSIILLSPSVPLLYMGQEWGTDSRFPYFCDFEPDLNEKVKQGRLKEFEQFTAFKDPQHHRHIPDPTTEETFESARLRWRQLEDPRSREWFDFHCRLLQLRHQHITPRLKDIQGKQAEYTLLAPGVLSVHWRLGDDSLLHLIANMSHVSVEAPVTIGKAPVFATHAQLTHAEDHHQLPPWSVVWQLSPSDG